MWYLMMTSMVRAGLSTCHVCRHQILYSRSYSVNHEHLNCTFLSMLRFDPIEVLSDTPLSRRWQSAQNPVCHMTQRDHIKSCYDTQGLSANVHATRERYGDSNKIVLDQNENSLQLNHRTLNTFTSKAQLSSQKSAGADASFCIENFSFLSTSISSNFNEIKAVQLYPRRTSSCRTKAYTNANQSNFKYKTREIGFSSLSSALLIRKEKSVKPEYCNLRTSAIHTSVVKKCVQDTGTIRQKPPWRILFFGTDDISLHTLKILYKNMKSCGSLVDTLEVVTGKKQRAVRLFAESEHLKIHDWPVATNMEHFDVGVLVSFGHLIPEAVIKMFPYGILNMHPSLLPRWRGASPIIHTILNGDEITGVSIMEIRPKHFDIGPLLLQRKCLVPYRCTSLQLADILGPFGAHMVLECLKDLPTLERFEHEQGDRGVTYAHKLKSENVYIDWENSTAEEIDCQYRAISELKLLKTELDGHLLKLLDVVDPNLLKDVGDSGIRGYKGNINEASPGTVAYLKSQKCIVVKCKEGVIGFKNLVLLKKLTALDFNNGFLTRSSCTKFTSLSNNLNKYVSIERIPVQAKV